MKYAVDRIEENIVVLENIDTGEIMEVGLKKLPRGASEKDIVVLVDGKYVLDLQEKEKRMIDLRARLEKLKGLE